MPAKEIVIEIALICQLILCRDSFPSYFYVFRINNFGRSYNIAESGPNG
jgi:hypothetical protein